jgi:acyl-CoA reductase-like NAD-dependent aldehyde dehydrogenase
MPANSILKKYIPIEQGALKVRAPFDGAEIATLQLKTRKEVEALFEKKIALSEKIRAGQPCDIGTIASRSAALMKAAEAVLSQK